MGLHKVRWDSASQLAPDSPHILAKIQASLKDQQLSPSGKVRWLCEPSSSGVTCSSLPDQLSPISHYTGNLQVPGETYLGFTFEEGSRYRNFTLN